jgi:hypothetical protein
MSQSWSILMFSLDSYEIPLSQVVLSFPNLYFILILNAHFSYGIKVFCFYLIDVDAKKCLLLKNGSSPKTKPRLAFSWFVIENSSCLIFKLKVLDLVLIF